jgi:hypothetical protein
MAGGTLEAGFAVFAAFLAGGIVWLFPTVLPFP